MFKIRPTEEEDFSKIDPVEEIQCEDGGKRNYPCYSLVEGDKVFVIGGIYQAEDERWYAWANVDKQAPRLSGYVALKRMMPAIMTDLRLQEVFCCVKLGFEKGERLAEHMGFTKCNTKEKYTVYRWTQ